VTDDPAGALDTSLLFDVFALSQAVGRLLAETMREGPLTPSEYAVYSAIFELEAASPTQLAARLGMRLTTFVDHLRAIERRQHARRLPHPDDRRSYRVVLTAAGLEAHRAANAQFERAHAAFEAELGPEAATAKSALRGIRSAANRATVALSAGEAMGQAPNAAPALVLSRRRSVGRAG
jgi:DNA-binding MarR family transcriptional regulator